MTSLSFRLQTKILQKILIIAFGLFAEAHAQGDFFKQHPWPVTNKISKGNMAPQQSSSRPRLFSKSTHLDTTTFSKYPAELTGLRAGTAKWIDFDNDGHLDIIVSGTNETVPVTKIYRNVNGVFTDIHADIPGIIASGLDWGDYDNDGDFDLAITGSLDSAVTMRVTKIFRNDNGVFVDIHAPLLGLFGGSTRWVDYDLDGKLDLFVCGSSDQGSTFYTKLYHNEDSVFVESPIELPGVWGSSVDWGDYDNDGYPDLLLTGYGTWGVTSGLFHNNHGSSFTYLPLPFQPVNFSSVSFGDFDNDGNLDFVVTGDPSGPDSTLTELYHNVGGGTFELVPTNLPKLVGGAVAWGDYDNDGKLDLAISGWHDGSTNITQIYHNDGGGVFTDIGADLPGTWWGSVAWGDVDNDGKLDLLICGASAPQPYCAFYFPTCSWNPFEDIAAVYHNNTSSPASAGPATPTGRTIDISGNDVTFQWNGASGSPTPQSMLTYNIRLGTSSGASDLIAPPVNAATGFCRVPQVGNNFHKLSRTIQLPEGRYYWSVQAVDNSYKGSHFSSEGVLDLRRGARWQLVSLPYSHDERRTSLVFPGALSSAFGYPDASRYVVADTMEYGFGYWVKFATPDPPAPLSGGSLGSVTVPVTEGWNLIGSISQSISVDAITSQTPGMTTSGFFGYSGSYARSDSILPGAGYWVKVNENGNLILSASSSTWAGSEKIRIVPTGENPPPAPGVSEDGLSSLPAIYALHQNYPNPFNPATSFTYQIATAGHVRLAVYDLLGREIAVVVDNERDPGEHTEKWNADGFPSGVYFYRIVTDGFSAIGKMVLIR